MGSGQDGLGGGGGGNGVVVAVVAASDEKSIYHMELKTEEDERATQ